MEAVFYDGVDVKSKVTELTKSAATAKTIMLEHEPGAVLAIRCRDNNNGDSGGLFFHCEPEDTTLWSDTGKFTVVEGTRECKVLAAGNPEDVPSGWTKNGFDDTSWKAPERNKGIST